MRLTLSSKVLDDMNGAVIWDIVYVTAFKELLE